MAQDPHSTRQPSTLTLAIGAIFGLALYVSLVIQTERGTVGTFGKIGAIAVEGSGGSIRLDTEYSQKPLDAAAIASIRVDQEQTLDLEILPLLAPMRKTHWFVAYIQSASSASPNWPLPPGKQAAIERDLPGLFPGTSILPSAPGSDPLVTIFVRKEVLRQNIAYNFAALVTAAFGTALLLLIVRAKLATRNRRIRAKRGQCPTCGYALAGLRTCPECGYPGSQSPK